MVEPQERKIYGQTGEIGRDGLLTPDQQMRLNARQERTADTMFNYLDRMQEGDLAPMAAMATGIGKGHIIHKILERQMRRDPNSKILLIAGTKLSLVSQTHEALFGYQLQEEGTIFDANTAYFESEDDDELIEDTTDIDEDILSEDRSFLYRTGRVGDPFANVHVATIQTVQSLMRRGVLLPEEYNLAIVDEGHNIGTPQRKETVDKFARRVGFTATPFRNSGRLKTPEQYGFTIVDSLPLPEAQEERFLPPLCGMQVDTKGLVDDIPLTKDGTIDYKKLEQLLKNSPDLRPFIADKIANIIQAEGRQYKTVVAVNFVWEAQEIAELLAEKGIKVGVAVNEQAARAIHTDEIPAVDALERYKLPHEDEKSVQVLISPYVASEGFDAPFTEVLVWASPTDSPLRYTQYVGRLARRSEGKAFGILVDFLYQTNKYKWSYNMAMWMKDYVQQLDNGLLWLGPETSIDEMRHLPQIEALRREASIHSTSELQAEGLEEIKESDFSLTTDNLRHYFIGHTYKLSAIASRIMEKLRSENPSFFVQRKSGPKIVPVTLDKQRFIEEMVKEGIRIKDPNMEEIKDTDFPVIQSAVFEAFIGDPPELLEIAKEVMRDIQVHNPELVTTRRRGSFLIPVVVDRNLFINALEERGLTKKSTDIEEIKVTDVSTGASSLREIFKESPILKKLADEVLEVLRIEDPTLLARRKNGVHTVTVVVDKDVFIRAMLDKGAQLKESGLEKVKETDFPLRVPELSAVFIGDTNKLRQIASEVVDDVRKNHPDKIVRRKSGVHGIEVVADRDLFIQLMVERGVRLRE